MKTIAAILITTSLAGCVAPMDPELVAHLEAERDFAYHQYYLQQVSERQAFRPEVYANDEFLADCEYYQMKECYE